MKTTSNVVQLPTNEEIEIAKDSSRTLSKYTSAEQVRISIHGSNDEHDELVLPGHVLQAMLEILVHMSNGNAFSIVPIHAELSTQEAASILNVSRTFLVSLLEDNKIPHHKVGTHRRVLAEDVLTYKQDIDKKRLKTLEELTALSQELGMGY